MHTSYITKIQIQSFNKDVPRQNSALNNIQMNFAFVFHFVTTGMALKNNTVAVEPLIIKIVYAPNSGDIKYK